MSCLGENCNSNHIQNKKYNLCGDCVFKKSHKGKSKQEVYIERAKKKTINIKPYKFDNLWVDEEAQKNIQNQDEAERIKKEIEGFGKLPKYKDDSIKLSKQKKRKSINKVSSKQIEINKLYKLTCIDMDHITEPVCTGCLKYQGGDIKLSHSHIISRADCHALGRPELIYDRNNITYHCMDFGDHKGCHLKHESIKNRKSLLDYEKNMNYIKSIDKEVYYRYTSK